MHSLLSGISSHTVLSELLSALLWEETRGRTIRLSGLISLKVSLFNVYLVWGLINNFWPRSPVVQQGAQLLWETMWNFTIPVNHTQKASCAGIPVAQRIRGAKIGKYLPKPIHPAVELEGQIRECIVCLEEVSFLSLFQSHHICHTEPSQRSPLLSFCFHISNLTNHEVRLLYSAGTHWHSYLSNNSFLYTFQKGDVASGWDWQSGRTK